VWRDPLGVKAGERQGAHATKTLIGTGLVRPAGFKTTHVSKIDERKVQANRRKHCALTVPFQQISSATNVGISASIKRDSLLASNDQASGRNPIDT
jgi:hypothetical protein